MEIKATKLTLKELHHLIDEHQQKDPRHAIQDMDGWAVNYTGTIITDYIDCTKRDMTKKEFKRKWGSLRNMLGNQDPGGCYGHYE